MGYFSNGTEGDFYRSAWCERCVNWRDEHDGRGDGCPIWDLHILYNYDQLKKSSLERALSSLIPREGIENGQCRLFWERGKPGPNGGGEEVPVRTLTVVRAA